MVTALCNDIGVEVVFSRQIAAFGRKQDIAVGLSTSGSSANLLRALEEASRRGMLTVGIAGYDGGKMAELEGTWTTCRGAVRIGAPDPGMPDHDVPRLMGTDSGAPRRGLMCLVSRVW